MNNIELPFNQKGEINMAKKYEFDYDLIVIGSGAGGSAAATIAAREGSA